MTFHSTESTTETATANATTDRSAGTTPAQKQPQIHGTAEEAYAAATSQLEKVGQMSGIGAVRLERLVEVQMLMTQALYLETRRNNDLVAAHIEALAAHTKAVTAPSNAAPDRSAD